MTASTHADGPSNIEDYGLIGDCTTAALVGRNGSIDWLCWPRFDSPACFAGLLGDETHGRWRICPAEADAEAGSRRSYIGDSMILETAFETSEGSFSVIDFMPMDQSRSSIVRIVVGRKGTPSVRMRMTVRFDYGSSTPWVTRLSDEEGISAIAGPNLVTLRSSVALEGQDLSTSAEFRLAEGERATFVLTYGPSHLPPTPAIDAEAVLEGTLEYWRTWSDRCTYKGHRRESVIRSLLTLKAMTFAETGGIVAAPTTSLPEQLGRSSELGLPLLLGSRRDPDLGSAHGRGLLRGGQGVARLAGTDRRRQPGRSADHVRRQRREKARRMGGPMASRISGRLARSGSETRLRTNSSSTFGAKWSTRCTWPAKAAWLLWPPRGRFNAWRWSTLNGSGWIPMTESGRCEAVVVTSPTRRSWHGSRSIAPFETWRNTVMKRRWSAGAGCATRSTRPSARRVSTPS